MLWLSLWLTMNWKTLGVMVKKNWKSVLWNMKKKHTDWFNRHICCTSFYKVLTVFSDDFSVNEIIARFKIKIYTLHARSCVYQLLCKTTLSTNTLGNLRIGCGIIELVCDTWARSQLLTLSSLLSHAVNKMGRCY